MALMACGSPVPIDDSGPVSDWRSYASDPGGSRYSPLTQITPENVDDLEIAWTFHTGETDTSRSTAFQLTPLLVDDKLIVCTPHQSGRALEPASGTTLWEFDPQLDPTIEYSNQYVCRGVAVWKSKNKPALAVISGY